MRKPRKNAARTKSATSRKAAAVASTPDTDRSTQEIALQAMGMLDQLEGLIPGFLHHDTNDAVRVGTVARFARELIPQVITTVTALPPVGGVNTFDVEGGKAALAFRDSWQPFVQRLSALLDGAQFTIDSKLAQSAGQALSTYAWAKTHARGPEGVALRPYLDEMTRTMKRTLNRHKPAATKTPPPTTPPSPPKGPQGFLAPNLAQAASAAADDEYDFPEDFRKKLEEAVKD